MASLSKSVIGSSAEERELQICRLGWSLLLLWLIMIIYMTKEIWFGETSIGLEEERLIRRRKRSIYSDE
ncbi:hypothetical protein L5515_010839 [Caenorhabditis briggsae]|uniref:Uncharacterized protein n=1 Tax=Caenorhabditis briggsae TaxID=6238 RepID=A0AAE9EUS2_CAEBR|nr:hypothetical protein L5515_010839 [Caenorhabditis briggsae]